MTNVDRILAEAMKFSDEERATLADRLLEMVPEVPDAGVEEAWLKETLRRRAEWKAGRARAVPVEEALRALAETAHHYQAREDSIRRCPLKKWTAFTRRRCRSAPRMRAQPVRAVTPSTPAISATSTATS